MKMSNNEKILVFVVLAFAFISYVFREKPFNGIDLRTCHPDGLGPNLHEFFSPRDYWLDTHVKLEIAYTDTPFYYDSTDLYLIRKCIVYTEKKWRQHR